jgi:phage terminase large subunit GpA-like protein
VPRDVVFEAQLAACLPEPILTVSEWSDLHRILPQKASAEPGPWRTARTPYLRKILDCLSSSSPYHTVLLAKGAQIGATEAGNNWIGYVIHHAPGPMLAVSPTVEMAKRASKQRIAPMIEVTPALADRVAPARERDSGNSLFAKEFAGGTLILTGANSAVGLRSMPARYLFLDEVDAYPGDLEGEGDPVELAVKRTATFRRNRKVFICSTPTLMDTSRIWRAWKETDQQRYFVPCPHCAEMQTIDWPRIVFDEVDKGKATLACSGCGTLIEERHKGKMLAAGEWRATAEGADPGVIGFHLSALYSPPGWYSWGDAARDFVAAKDHPEKLKTFVNTVLGEPWEDRQGESLDEGSLRARRGAWDAESLPEDVICLTAGVDTQDDRLEASIVGWSEGQRARVVAHHILYGSPGQADVWQALDTLLQEKLPTQDGRAVRVVGACIDSGGHHTQAVYRFTSTRAARSVYAIKGVSGPKPAWPPLVSKSKRHRTGRVWMIGVDTIKDWLRGALAVKDESLPHHVSFAGTLDDEYFAQLLIEKRVVKYSTAGHASRSWVKPKGARNEAWDALVYAFAALEALKVMRRFKLIAPPKPQSRAAEAGPAISLKDPSQPPPAVKRRGGFVNSWRS